MAIDRREYALAETFISRAKRIPWWEHLRQLTLPMSCRRLIAVAEIAFARRIAIAAPSPSRTHPLHPDDDNRLRRKAGFQRATKVIDMLGGSVASPLLVRIERAFVGRELVQAAKFARAEVGLHLFPKRSSCEPLAATLPAVDVKDEAKAAELNLLRLRARIAIRIAVSHIE